MTTGLLSKVHHQLAADEGKSRMIVTRSQAIRFVFVACMVAWLVFLATGLAPLRPAHAAHLTQTTKIHDSQKSDSENYDWNLPTGVPLPRLPADNPMTKAKVELGRYLFYDTRLSGNSTQACATCHLQSLAFADGRQVPIGSTGQAHMRNSPALVNVAYYSTLTWANPILLQIEKQVLMPMFGEFPVEMGITGKEKVVLARFQADPQYQILFAEAFPQESEAINIANVSKALASFVRSLTSFNSPYDRYVYQKDKSALSASAKRGMELFFGEELECHHCHTGFNFSASTVTAKSTMSSRVFQNNGLYNLDGQGAYPRGNRGLFESTSEPGDMGRFRPPSLRNVELTAPYMHDGSIATLEDVIRHYAAGGRLIESGEYAGDGRISPYKSGLVAGFRLTDQKLTDLVNFLKSLTDKQFITDPNFSNPFRTTDDVHVARVTK